jgi:glycopeptide antibiotics resistance protein
VRESITEDRALRGESTVSRLLPSVLALAGATVLAFLLFVPFVIRSYRRRGELGFGPAVVAFGMLVYSLALVAYTMLPIPPVDAAWCAAHPKYGDPQLNPLQFVHDIRTESRTPGLRGMLANPALQQVLFNVALFVPLGAFVARRFRPGLLAAAAAGFGVSLLIEVTQLTGNWFLFPCPYRLFDVDDLLANTLGAVFGVLLAPLLRRLTARPDAPPDVPRPVTTGRRLLGMVVDMVSVFLLGGVIAAVANLLAWFVADLPMGEQPFGRITSVTLNYWLPAALVLALPSFGRGGATFGQRAVRLRRERPDGRPAGLAVVPALLGGGFGYYVLVGSGQFSPLASTLAFLLGFVCLVLAWRPRSHRGLSGLVSGLVVVDARVTVVNEESHRTADQPGR